MRNARAGARELLLLGGSFVLALGLSEIALRLFVPVHKVGPAFTVYDSVYGQRLKKNLRARRIEKEFTMQISTNSYGFRAPEPSETAERSVVFLGDSFTVGRGRLVRERF